MFAFSFRSSMPNGETDRRSNNERFRSFGSSVPVGVGRRLRRTSHQAGYSFAIKRLNFCLHQNIYTFPTHCI